jgi:HlyD family secretion protein
MNPITSLDHRHSLRVALIPLYVITILVALSTAALVFLKMDRVVAGKGTLVPPANSVKISSCRAGEVAEILVRDGQKVAAGEVLVRLDDRDDASAFASLTAQLDVARLELDRRAKLIASRRKLADVRGEILRSERDVERAGINPLQADASRTARDFERLGKELAKKQSLAEQRVLTQSEFDAAKAEREKSYTERIQLDAQIAQKKMLVEQLQRKADGQVLETDVETLREELSLLEGRRTVATLERQIAETKLKLERAALRAPVAGVVHALSVKAPGEQVQTTDVVCRIVPPEAGMVAEIELPAGDIGFVHVGQEARLKLDAFPFEDYGVVRGQVEFVAPDADPETKDDRKRRPAYTLRVRLNETRLVARDGTPLQLRPGMTLRAELVNRRESLGAIVFRPFRAASQEVGFD